MRLGLSLGERRRARGDTEATYTARAARDCNVYVAAGAGWILYKFDDDGNLEPYTLADAEARRQAVCAVIALRDIAKGETLAMAYGWDYWKSW